MSIPAGYRCLECEGYTSADDTVSTGHYEWCPRLPPRPVRHRDPTPDEWEIMKRDLSTKNRGRIPPSIVDDWRGPRPIDPPPNPLSLANHVEINRLMTERVEAEERWLLMSLGARGIELDADAVSRCMLETRTEHLPNGLRYEAVLKIDGYVVDPPFIWTLTYEGVPP